MPRCPAPDPPCLACLPTGALANVVTVTGTDALATRLQDLGLLPGTPVEVLRRAPFGDPLLVRLHGYRLALRHEEARRVEVTDPVGSPS
jgi:ferrous iron transport protein A